MKKLIPALLLLSLCHDICAKPIVIAHRGASGYYPEHTLEAYHAAIEMGADYIEPDLVMTSDGVLIARHDLFLSTTSNVADVFPDRKRTVDDKEDWYVSDFTLEEIRQLSARQSFGNRTREHDDRWPIPTLDDIMVLLKEQESLKGRSIGLYPELKDPAYHRQLGFSIGDHLLKVLTKHSRESDVYIQSFDPDTLRDLRNKTDLPLIMLLFPRSRSNPSEPNIPLATVARFADGVGVMKFLLLDQSGNE